MRKFLEFVAKHLVDQPELVALKHEEKDNRVVFRLKVGEDDVGKVIRRRGRTAQAIRTLLVAVAAKEGKRVIVEIAD